MDRIPTIIDESTNKSCSRIIPILILVLLLLILFPNKEPLIPKPIANLFTPNIKANLTDAKTLHIKTKHPAIIRNLAVIANDDKSTIYEMKGSELPKNVQIKSIVIDSPDLNNAIVQIKDSNGAVLWTNTSPVNKINDVYVIKFEKSVYPTKQQVLDPNLSENQQEQFLFYYK